MKKAKEQSGVGLNPRLEQQFLNRLEADYYTDIDVLPIYFWQRINETQDPTYLLRQRKKPGKLAQINCSLLWRILLDQFIKQFGFGEDFLRIIRKQQEMISLMIRTYGEG